MYSFYLALMLCNYMNLHVSIGCCKIKCVYCILVNALIKFAVNLVEVEIHYYHSVQSIYTKRLATRSSLFADVSCLAACLQDFFSTSLWDRKRKKKSKKEKLPCMICVLLNLYKYCVCIYWP